MKKQLLVTVDRGETESASSRRREIPPALTRRRAAERRADDWRVAELYIERRGNRSIVGNIYKGKVDNVLPGLEAAFVDIGLDKNGFLHADDLVFPGVEVAHVAGAPGAPRASGSASCSSPARRSSSRRSRIP